MTRKEANIRILQALVNYISDSKNDDQRFGQILRNIGIVKDYIPEGEFTPRWVNHFNEEPQEMLKRINEKKNR